MAYATVDDSISGNSGGNSSSHTITLPTGNGAGDLIVILFACDGTAGAAMNASYTGWTELFDVRTGCTLACYYKTLSGNETSVVIDTANESAAWIVYQISGHDSTTSLEAGTTASGSDDSPDPPSLNPSGWDTEDTLWIATCGRNSNPSCSAYPYTSNQLDDYYNNGPHGAGISACTTNSAAASVDPGTFTLSGSDDWQAQTIAIRPQGATNQTETVPVATAASSAATPTISPTATVTVPAATATGSPVAPAISAQVTTTVPVATGASSAAAPSLVNQYTLTMPVAVATSLASAPKTVISQNVTVPAASASAVGSTVFVHTEIQTVVPVVSGSSTAVAPTTTLETTITVPNATAPASAVIPTIDAQITKTTPVASASASAVAPATGGTQTVTMPVALATGTAVATTIDPTLDVSVPAASAVASAVDCGLSLTRDVTMPSAIAYSTAIAPSATGGTPVIGMNTKYRKLVQESR